MNIGKNGSEIVTNIVESTVKKAGDVLREAAAQASSETKTVDHASSEISATYNKAIAQIQSNTTPAEKSVSSSTEELTELEKLFTRLESKGKTTIKIDKEGDEIDVIFYKGKHHDYFKSPDGKIFRVRYSKDNELNETIVGTAKQYRIRGFKAPEMMLVDINGKRGVASELITDLTDKSTNPKALYDIFGTDVLLAQRHAYSKGTTMLDANGNIVKVSTSGACGYRVRGEKRPDFNEELIELRSFLDPKINPESAEIFKDMTREDLLKSINRAIGEHIWAAGTPHNVNVVLEKRHKALTEFYKRAYHMPQEEGETLLQYITRVQNKIKELNSEGLQYGQKLREYVNSLGIIGQLHYRYNHEFKYMDAKEAIERLIQSAEKSEGMAKALYLRAFSKEEFLKLAEYNLNVPSSYSSCTRICLNASPDIASKILYSPNKVTQCTFDEFVRFYAHECSFRPCRKGSTHSVQDNTLVERGLLEDFTNGKISFDDMVELGTLRDESYARITQRGLTEAIEGRIGNLSVELMSKLGTFNDERYAKVLERGLLRDLPDRSIPLTGDDLYKLSEISEEDWARVIKFDLLNNMNPNGTSSRLLTGENIKDILKFSTDEEIETAFARDLFNKKYQKVLHYGSEISTVAKLSDTEFNNLIQRGLFTNEKYHDYFERDFFYKTAPISKADEDLLKLYGIDIKKEYSGWSAQDLVDISRLDCKYRIAEISELNIPDPSGRTDFGKIVDFLNKKTIVEIAKLPEKEYQRALSLLRKPELVKTVLLSEDICKVVSCSDETWETMQRRGFLSVNNNFADAKTLFNMGYTSEPELQKISAMELLSRIPDDKWNKLIKHNIVSTNPKRGQLGPTDIYEISKMPDEEFEKLLKTGIFDKDYDKTLYGGNEFFHTHALYKLKNICKTLTIEEIETLAKRGFLGEMTSASGKYIGDYMYMAYNDAAKIAANLTDEQVKLYRELADITEDYNNWVNLHLAKSLSPEEIQIVKDRNLLMWCNTFEGAESGTARVNMVTELVKLNETEWKFVQRMISNKGMGHVARTSGFTSYALNPGKNMAHLVEFVGERKRIHEFSLKEKRQLLNMLIRTGGSEVDREVKFLMPDNTIIPKTMYKRKLLINQLTESIGLKSKILTEAQRAEFFEALGKMAQKDSGIMSTNFDAMSVNSRYPVPTPKLLYSRTKFSNDIYEQVKDLPLVEQRKIFEYFSFEVENKGGRYQLNGYPFANKTAPAMHDIEDARTLEVLEKLRPLVEKFSNGNKIFVEGNPKLEAELNKILEIFPEFATTIGKVQHDTQDFTVDVHTLKVLQQVMTDSRFEQLSDADKQIIQLSTILHDITKIERTIDKSHPAESAFDAYYLVDRLNLPRSEKLKIYEVIKNHDWLEQINKKVKIGENKYRNLTEQEKAIIANKIAFAHRQNDCFRMATILTKADLMGVQKGDAFYKKYEQAYLENVERIQKLIDKIKETAIHIPQTRIPKASELVEDGKIVKSVTKDGITNKVIYLEPGQDLSKIGFDEGVTSDILNVIVHALDAEEQAVVFRALGLVDSDALLSSSWINYAKGNYKVFRGQGFVLKVDSDDIHAGTYRDFGSGFKKDYDTLLKEYIFGTERAEMRTYWSNCVKEKFGFTTEEYMKFNDRIKNKSFDQIMKEDPEIAIKIQEIVDNMDTLRRKGGRNYNEWLISRPEIQAGFYWGKGTNGKPKTIDDVPLFIREYLAENNLPLIFFGV